MFTKDTIIYADVAPPKCITENVTEGSIVASGKMLLFDRRNSLLEEQHDEPEKQARLKSRRFWMSLPLPQDMIENMRSVF